jgi:LVIVD repeat
VPVPLPLRIRALSEMIGSVGAREGAQEREEGTMSMRKVLIAVGAVAAFATVQLAPGAAAPPPRASKAAKIIRSGELLDARFAKAAGVVGRAELAASDDGAQARNVREVGRLHIEGGLHGDVWAHRRFAYVGTWSGPCPGTGVKIINARKPRKPKLVATAAGYPNTSAEDMQVVRMRTAAFRGDLLAVGLQDCGLEGQDPGLTGVDLWEVTHPRDPRHLGFYEAPASSGVHEVSLMKRRIAGRQRVFALAAVPFSEVTTALFGAPEVIGDFQLVDITDPRNPVLADDWGAGKDGRLPFGSPLFGEPAPFDCTAPPGAPELCRGHFPAVFDHSTSSSRNGKRAYLAYWDAGAIILDISDPGDVRMIGRTEYPPDSEGDTHSAVDNRSGKVLVTTDEDFSPGETAAAGEEPAPDDTWGFARIWGIRDPASPAHLSDFATPHSLTNDVSGFYTAHNPEIHGTRLYLSWYSDGLRIVNIAKPARPREIGFFVPPPTLDPTGVFAQFGPAGAQPIPFVWGIHKENRLIYLSDINFGLYIVKRAH